jgi:hypothetical protein
MRVQRPGPRKLRPAHVGRLIQMVRSSAGPAPARRSWERRAPGTGNDQARTSAMSSVSLLQAWKPAAPPALSSSMQLGRAAVISRTRGTLLLPRTQASVAELTRQALAPDEEWAQAGCCLTRPRVVRSGRLRRAGRECPKQAKAVARRSKTGGMQADCRLESPRAYRVALVEHARVAQAPRSDPGLAPLSAPRESWVQPYSKPCCSPSARTSIRR